MGERLKIVRLQKAAREFNVGISTIVDYLNKKGIRIESNPNTKLTPEIYEILLREFESEKNVKEEASKIGLSYAEHETVSIDDGKAKKTEDDAVNKEPLTKETPQDDLFIKTKTISSDTPKEKEAQKEVVADKKVSTKEDDAQIATEKPKETTSEKKEAKERKPEPAEKPAEKSEKEKTSIKDESSGKDDDKIKEEAKEEGKEKAAKEDKKSKEESPEEKEQLTEANESATEKKETIA
jgi:translation initiation factor IF-2